MSNNHRDDFMRVIDGISNAEEGSLLDKLQAFQKIDRYARKMRSTHDFQRSDYWRAICLIGFGLLQKIRDELYEKDVIDGLELNPELLFTDYLSIS